MSATRREEIEREINQQRLAAATLEAQRAVLGEATVAAALTSIHRRVAGLERELTAIVPASERIGADERKRMTVLQADVVGSTALAGSMDPEEWKVVLGEAHRRIREAIVAQGGVIAAVIGDGVVAFFGARQTHEDDPHRALRAGLAIQSSITTYAEQLQARRGIVFRLRLGIATGMAVIGGQWSDRALTAVGAPLLRVNVLEQQCRPGTVLCDLATMRAVGPQFEVRARPLAQTQDTADEEYGWEVLRERPRQPLGRRPRAILGQLTPTVGREQEQAALRGAWGRVVERAQPWALTLIGEAGLGKSRLLDEMRTLATEDHRPVWLLTAAAVSNTAGVPFWLLRDLLALRAGLPEDARREEAEQAIERTVTELWPAEEGGVEAAHVLGYLAGFGFSESRHVLPRAADPRTLRSDAFRLTEGWLRRMAQRHPICFLIEDLHWADASSLDWLAHLVAALDDLPVVTVMTARRAFTSRRPDWLLDVAHHHALHLKPLEWEAAHELGQALLSRVAGAPPHLVARLAERAEGNPFYLEELVKTLIEQGAIRAINDVWQVVSPDDVWRLLDAMPAGLQALLQSRLDALPPDLKMTIQRAAVIGRTFWAGAVAHLAGHATTSALDGLVERELIVAHPAAVLAGEQEFQFTHALLRDVAYEMLPRRARRPYHAAIAEWLEQRTEGDGIERFATVIADHYFHADNAPRARHWYTVAAADAARAYANDLARDYYSRALALTPPEERRARLQLLHGRQRILSNVGDLPAEDADLTEMEALARALDDAEALAEACALRAIWCWRSGHSSQGLGWTAEGRALLAGTRPSILLSRLLRAEGVCHFYLGAYDTAMAVTEEALAVARAAGDIPSECHSLNNLGMIAFERSGVAGAMHFYEEALALAEAADLWSTKSVPLANLALGYERLGDYEKAMHYHQRSLELDRRLGARRGEAGTLHNLGMLHWALGDDRQAMRYVEQSLGIYRALRDTVGEALVLADIALMLTRRGEHWEALIYAEQGVATLRAVEQVQELWGVVLVQAENLFALERYAEAEAAVAEMQALLASLNHPQEAWALSLGALIALAQGDLPAADRASARAVSLGVTEIFRGLGPQRFWWVRYQVLMALGRHTEAQQALDTAHDQILAQGIHITTPAWRQSFLTQVPLHREIMATWQASLPDTEGLRPRAASPPRIAALH